LRDAIAEQNAVAVIPPRKTSPQVACDFALYCERHLVELNRSGFAGGSNFQIGWSHHEQDDEQVFT
jgi:hypothetical protein